MLAIYTIRHANYLNQGSTGHIEHDRIDIYIPMPHIIEQELLIHHDGLVVLVSLSASLLP